MKLSKREKRKRYIRLFKLFEEELKNYHDFFVRNHFTIDYIICRDYFGDDDEIKIIFNINVGTKLKVVYQDDFNLKQLLTSYCRYFSIRDVIITKSARAEIEGKNFNPLSVPVPKIQDRVFFEYFRLIDKYSEVLR